MRILSHRGMWNDFATESNKAIAFTRSFDFNLGTETDIRDCGGNLLISHDMPCGKEMPFEEFLELAAGRNLPLALNIKADGLGGRIKELLERYGQKDYFTFDMSIPDMVVQMDMGLRVYTGMSDILPSPVLLKRAAGVWLDSFYSDWFSEDDVRRILDLGKGVCIVSADLHKRDVKEQWDKLGEFSCIDNPQLMLCTDMAEAAIECFGDEI